jgi:hypothetical protein
MYRDTFVMVESVLTKLQTTSQMLPGTCGAFLAPYGGMGCCDCNLHGCLNVRLTCVPAPQINDLYFNMLILAQDFGECPACLANFWTLFCAFTCSPYQVFGVVWYVPSLCHYRLFCTGESTASGPFGARSLYSLKGAFTRVTSYVNNSGTFLVGGITYDLHQDFVDGLYASCAGSSFNGISVGQQWPYETEHFLLVSNVLICSVL